MPCTSRRKQSIVAIIDFILSYSQSSVIFYYVTDSAILALSPCTVRNKFRPSSKFPAAVHYAEADSVYRERIKPLQSPQMPIEPGESSVEMGHQGIAKPAFSCRYPCCARERATTWPRFRAITAIPWLFGLSGTTTAANPRISFSVDQERPSTTRDISIRSIRNTTNETLRFLRLLSLDNRVSPPRIAQLPFSAYREHPHCNPRKTFSVYPEHRALVRQAGNSAYQEQFRHIGNRDLVYPVRIIGLSGTLCRPIRNSLPPRPRTGSQSPSLDRGSNLFNPFNLSN